MLAPIPACPRRRARRTLLAAALVTCALPAAAAAATVEQAPDGNLHLRAGSGEVNQLRITDNGGGVDLSDPAGLTSRTPLCAQRSRTQLRCAIGMRLSFADLGDRDDSFRTFVPARIQVAGGTGDDAYAGATVAGGSTVDFGGGPGTDVAAFGLADRPVHVSREASDGRPGLDQDTIRADVERIIGSPFADVLRTVGDFGVLAGAGGDDLLDGRGATSATFEMGAQADGADRILALGAVSEIDYSERTRPVTATFNAGGTDDGEAGERDEIVVGGFVLLEGGHAGDTIRADQTQTFVTNLLGHGGGDTIAGGPGGDLIEGGAGTDTMEGNGGDDTIRANDGIAEVIACGAGAQDSVRLDSLDRSSSCENRRVAAPAR